MTSISLVTLHHARTPQTNDSQNDALLLRYLHKAVDLIAHDAEDAAVHLVEYVLAVAEDQPVKGRQISAIARALLGSLPEHCCSA
jgi:hypothetical protein